MFTISRTTPSNIESSTFAQHNNNTTFRSRACTSRDGGNKKRKKTREGIGYTGGLVSQDHERCSPRLASVNTVACLNLPQCRALEHRLSSSLLFSRRFSFARLRRSFSSSSSFSPPSPLPSPPRHGFTVSKGPATIDERKYFRSEELYTDVKRKVMRCKYCN